ncbi:MAG: deoxyguanosinetriphosphate triphosphohydrolase [Dongiaceae bacterium]
MTPPDPCHACASHPERSRGRLVPEPESSTRSVYQRDRDRIIHSGAFRRLKHKTQVFVYDEGDYYRTRLTHSIEVAQVARSVCRALGFNEDLAEALALAHDLGHPPFGHAGEEALAAAMSGLGGFDHNEQTFRILTMLERRYAAFDGLNLTWECLEGVVKHNGPLIGPAVAKPRPVPATIADYCATRRDLELDTWPGPEAQVAALADDIAYNNHDIDDGLRAGLFSVGDLAGLPLAGSVFDDLMRRYPGLESGRLIHEAVRRLIDLMVNDLIDETRRRLRESMPQSTAGLRRLGFPVAAFSAEMHHNDRALKQFLFERMYRHERVNRMTANARQTVQDLFGRYMNDVDVLPPDWRVQCDSADRRRTARVVADYIAGMTDRYALDEHARLFGSPARP